MNSMNSIIFSTEAFIGLAFLAVFFVTNEVVPMVSHKSLPLIAMAAGVVFFLFYGGII